MGIWNFKIYLDGDEDILVFYVPFNIICLFYLCWGFTAHSTQRGHVERGQFT